MEFEYKIVRTRRRSVSLQISRQAEVIVRVPLYMHDAAAKDYVTKNQAWILEHLKSQRLRMERYELTDEEIEEIKWEARQVIPLRVQHFAQIMELAPKSVKITGAQTRFGSCGANNGLCFSYYLMKYPPEAVDYVVVHELAHIVHKNHGAQFYALIEKYMPDYKSRILLLKQ